MAPKNGMYHDHDPTPQQEADYAIEHAVDRAVLAHPDTMKLRKRIATEMKKATKVPATDTRPASRKSSRKSNQDNSGRS